MNGNPVHCGISLAFAEDRYARFDIGKDFNVNLGPFSIIFCFCPYSARVLKKTYGMATVSALRRFWYLISFSQGSVTSSIIMGYFNRNTNARYIRSSLMRRQLKTSGGSINCRPDKVSLEH